MLIEIYLQGCVLTFPSLSLVSDRLGKVLMIKVTSKDHDLISWRLISRFLICSLGAVVVFPLQMTSCRWWVVSSSRMHMSVKNMR